MEYKFHTEMKAFVDRFAKLDIENKMQVESLKNFSKTIVSNMITYTHIYLTILQC